MSETIMTRKEAKAQRLTVYHTGNPCPKGHYGPRYVASYTCVQCDAERSARRNARLKAIKNAAKKYS